MDEGTAGSFCVVRAVLGALCCGHQVSTPANVRTSPLRGEVTTNPCPLRRRSWHCRETPWDPEAAERGLGCRVAYDVLQTGTGTAHSKVVTRCKSALTGQELGRWRRMRSLYCLTRVAILKRVRMTVEGCACASVVCCSVCLRKAWCRA